jgi:hypothetical protein
LPSFSAARLVCCFFPALAFLSSSVLFRRDGIWSLPVFGGAVSRLIKRYHDSRDGE